MPKGTALLVSGRWPAAVSVLVCYTGTCVTFVYSMAEAPYVPNPAEPEVQEKGEPRSGGVLTVLEPPDRGEGVETEFSPPGAREAEGAQRMHPPQTDGGREHGSVKEDASGGPATRVSWKPVKAGEGILLAFRTALAGAVAVVFALIGRESLQHSQRRYSRVDIRGARQHMAVENVATTVVAITLLLHARYLFNFVRDHRQVVSAPAPLVALQKTTGPAAADAGVGEKIADQADTDEGRDVSSLPRSSPRPTKKYGLARKIVGYDLVRHTAVAAAAWLVGTAVGKVNYGEETWRNFRITSAARYAGLTMKGLAMLIAAVTGLRAFWRGAKATFRTAKGIVKRKQGKKIAENNSLRDSQGGASATSGSVSKARDSY
ncbi:hypothetical protein CSUI_005695 [Cystoisospora suis]|uniref:Transmembrane protein n=1 Tax=Cystoisospora suis TaxID=483139 RepID=A0A2C6KSW4_9APIC|nr:hypothetical protein CSUI_005695 [Cystoisospora suis]